jgi:hypothetical protein
MARGGRLLQVFRDAFRISSIGRSWQIDSFLWNGVVAFLAISSCLLDKQLDSSIQFSSHFWLLVRSVVHWSFIEILEVRVFSVGLYVFFDGIGSSGDKKCGLS